MEWTVDVIILNIRQLKSQGRKLPTPKSYDYIMAVLYFPKISGFCLPA